MTKREILEQIKVNVQQIKMLRKPEALLTMPQSQINKIVKMHKADIDALWIEFHSVAA